MSLLAVVSPHAAAPEIAGRADPRFEAALAAWLDDDDATAIPVFAALAAEDNRAAQVMLGLIDVERLGCKALGWPDCHGPSGAP